jgi:cytochrome d ubiquinol oxidase subunit II
VAAIIAGWALAQRPTFLPGLTIDEAAAGRSTLIALLLSIVIGALLLLPSLALLFGLVLRGRFDAPVATETIPPDRTPPGDGFPTRLVASAAGLLAIGSGLMLVFDDPWARIAGVIALFAFMGTAFVALASRQPAG